MRLRTLLLSLLLALLLAGPALAVDFADWGTYGLESLYLAPGHHSLVPDPSESRDGAWLTLAKEDFLLSGSEFLSLTAFETHMETLDARQRETVFSFLTLSEDAPLLPYDARVFFSDLDRQLANFVLYRYQDHYYFFVQNISGEDGSETVLEILRMVPEEE